MGISGRPANTRSIYTNTLIVLTFVNLVNYLDRYILAAVAPKIQLDLNLSNFETGLLMSAFMLGYMIASPFFGYLGDRRRRPFLMGFGVFVWSIATFVSGLAGSFLALFTASMAVGIGDASYATIAPSYIRDNYDNDIVTNKALSFFYTAIPVGAALGSV